MANYSYEPTLWIGGKTIGTADVMNNIENGIVNSYSFTNSVLGVINNHITNHPGGGGGGGEYIPPESATDDDINGIFSDV